MTRVGVIDSGGPAEDLAQARAFLPVITVDGRVFEHRHVLRQVPDRLGDQVVVLGRLIREHDAVLRRELARPQPGTVDDHVRRDVAEGRRDARDTAVLLQHACRRHAFEDLHAAHARAFRERHGLSKTRFGLLALNDKAFHSQLEGGRFLFPKTEAKVRKFMAEYTPTKTPAPEVEA